MIIKRSYKYEKNKCFKLEYSEYNWFIGVVTVNAPANITALLVDAGWNKCGISEVFRTVFVITTAGIIITVFDIAYVKIKYRG